MTWLYRDPIFQQHQTGAHPERPQRLACLDEHLSPELLAKCPQPPCPDATPQQVARVHDPDYVAEVRRIAQSGGGWLDGDTVASPRSYDVALRAAGAACDAVRRVLAAPATANALCLVRPPGHHALANAAMGFCLLNNVAIAAQAALHEGHLDRVMVVDWDVHHGNGTQDAFWRDERASYLSIHRHPFYPGTGDQDETGAGPGLGTICNLPVTFGTARSQYHQRFADRLVDFAGRMRPQLILISAGFDAHRLDPIGSLGLESEDFAQLTDTVQQVADQHCQGKLVSLLEGGYNLDVLPACVEAHLARLVAVGGE